MNPEDRVDEYLMHYGVMGMKWGKRKARVSKTNVQAPKKRRMSNKELQARIKRLKLEKEYAQLTSNKPNTVRVEQIVKSLGTIAALSTSAITIYNNIGKVAKIAKTLSGN